MTPGTDEVRSAVSPLVARCPTFEAASSTVEYLSSRGVPREALCVVADEVSAAGPFDGGWRWRLGLGRTARMRVHGYAEPVMSRRYYVVSDGSSARTARQLLRTGADAQREAFGVQALPCVGQLSSKSQHPSNGVVRTSRWSRWVRRRFEKA